MTYSLRTYFASRAAYKAFLRRQKAPGDASGAARRDAIDPYNPQCRTCGGRLSCGCSGTEKKALADTGWKTDRMVFSKGE
jgi:hypothetical protein